MGYYQLFGEPNKRERNKEKREEKNEKQKEKKQ